MQIVANHMKTKSKTAAHIIRRAAVATLLLSPVVTLSLAFNAGNKAPGSSSLYRNAGGVTQSANQARMLTFAERVAYQRAIEDVYWRHRIWPKENPDPKPSIDAVMSQAQLETKVANYLHNSQALEDYWQRPITSERLQAEMDRMARDTKQAEVLRELFEALGNDPSIIAECLARPVLTDRLVTDLSVQDKGAAFDSARPEALRTESMTMSGHVAYTVPKITEGIPCTEDTWTPTSIINAPHARDFHTAVWTGSEMIIWGGMMAGSRVSNTGARYNPTTDSWIVTSTANAPDGRSDHTVVWTGSEMIVWGGRTGVPLNTGGRYNPITDTWTATSTTNAPDARNGHTAVWSGNEMIVWGGFGNSAPLNTGGKYNPETDSWIATSLTNAPQDRYFHAAVWAGSEMIVWGGEYLDGTSFSYLDTGGRYNPATDSWTGTSTTNAPTARECPAVWTGNEMIVWGGDAGNSSIFNTGGRYSPASNSWAPTSITNAASARSAHAAVWTGSEMIVWGGAGGGSGALNTGGRYNPSTDSWVATSITNAPAGRYSHTAVCINSEMIVWGGRDPSGVLNTGGRYCVQSGVPSPTPSASATPTATATPTLTPTPTPPCTGRCAPTPRPRPTPAPRP